MNLNFDRLDELPRAELLALGRQYGIERPERMTRAELKDELVRVSITDAALRERSRGWFGVARDLVASVVEAGLHMPDAAKVIRGDVPRVDAGQRRPPVATVTLAEIYATQGHTRRALKMLEQVLAKEPDHEVARALKEQLERQTGSDAPPAPRGPASVSGLGARGAAPGAQAAPEEQFSNPPVLASSVEAARSPQEAPAVSAEPALAAEAMLAAEVEAPGGQSAPNALELGAEEAVARDQKPEPAAAEPEPEAVRTLEEPEVSAEEPEPAAAEPEAVRTLEEPEVSAEEPAPAATEPEAVRTLEEASAEEPEPAAAEPEAVRTLEEASAEEPEPAAAEPEAVRTLEEPEASAEALGWVLTMRLNGVPSVVWQVSGALLERVRERHAESRPVIKIVGMKPGWEGASRLEHEVLLERNAGQLALPQLTEVPCLRTALGLNLPDGFVPLLIGIDASDHEIAYRPRGLSSARARALLVEAQGTTHS